MENTEGFEEKLYKLLKEARAEGMSDATIAYVLLREGNAYYFRDICQREKPT